MSRRGQQAKEHLDIPTMSRIIRDWGLDDPEGKQLAIERLRAAQAAQGIPVSPNAHLYRRPVQPASEQAQS